MAAHGDQLNKNDIVHADVLCLFVILLFLFLFFSTIYLNVFVTSVCQLLQHKEPVMIRIRYIL